MDFKLIDNHGNIKDIDFDGTLHHIIPTLNKMCEEANDGNRYYIFMVHPNFTPYVKYHRVGINQHTHKWVCGIIDLSFSIERNQFINALKLANISASELTTEIAKTLKLSY